MQPVRVPLLRKFRLRKWMYFFLAFQALAIAGWLGYVTAGKRFTARQTEVVPTVVPEVRVPAPALVADTALVAGTLDAPQWLDTVVVEAGTRLTLLSLSYYGDKVFWVYVYIANRDVIKDPNRVPAGASLRIPMPDRYRIDAADKESVARAAKLQREILAGNFEGVDALDKLAVNL